MSAPVSTCKFDETAGGEKRFICGWSSSTSRPHHPARRPPPVHPRRQDGPSRRLRPSSTRARSTLPHHPSRPSTTRSPRACPLPPTNRCTRRARRRSRTQRASHASSRSSSCSGILHGRAPALRDRLADRSLRASRTDLCLAARRRSATRPSPSTRCKTSPPARPHRAPRLRPLRPLRQSCRQIIINLCRLGHR